MIELKKDTERDCDNKKIERMEDINIGLEIYFRIAKKVDNLLSFTRCLPEQFHFCGENPCFTTTKTVYCLKL